MSVTKMIVSGVVGGAAGLLAFYLAQWIVNSF